MIIGMDIGYSNLKVCFGTGLDDYQTRVLPVGVKERDDLGLYKPPEDSIDVLVDGVEYIAGVPFGTGETRTLSKLSDAEQELMFACYMANGMNKDLEMRCLRAGIIYPEALGGAKL